MSTPGSVSHWIAALKGGDAQAAQMIWERYCARLVGLARQKLAARRGGADEEDVVQNAFTSFFQGVARGRFPQLDDRDNLWKLLVVITARKAVDQLAHEHSRRRGGGTVRAASQIDTQGDDESLFDRAVADGPTPEFAAQVAEQYQRLLDALGDETLRRVAVWKMEGHTRDEIAGLLGCSRRTVARKLDTIRILWQAEVAP